MVLAEVRARTRQVKVVTPGRERSHGPAHIFPRLSPQAPLKNSVCGDVRAGLQSYADVCDAVFVLEIGLRFLAKTGGDPQGQLLPFLTDSLKLESQISGSVAKVGTSDLADASTPTPIMQRMSMNSNFPSPCLA